MMGIEREEAGYEKLERRRFETLVRETSIANTIFAITALIFDPLAWLLGRGKEKDEDRPAPDYSRAERIPEETR